MQKQLEPSRQIEIVSGSVDSLDTIHIAHVSEWILKKFTTFQPHKLKDDKLYLNSTIRRAKVRRICRWIVSVAITDRPQPMRCPEEFEDALRLYEAMKAMSCRSNIFGREVVDGLIEYVRGPALTSEEFVLIMSTTLADTGLWDAAIAETEARYRDGLRGGFEGVPERAAIIAFAADRGIEIELGQEGNEDDLARNDTPLEEKEI